MARRRLAGEAGTGLVATLGGVLAFLLFLLLAAQVLLHLYATSVVTAAAFDAARIVSADDGEARQGEALAHARNLLGRFGDDAAMAFTRIDDDVVVLQVRAESPSLLPRVWAHVTGVGAIEREIRMRRETFR